MVVGVSALWQVSRGSRANGYGSCHLARRLELFGGHGNAEVYPVNQLLGFAFKTESCLPLGPSAAGHG